MGVHKLNPNITNMKFQLTLALAAVCVANAGKIQDKAEDFASKQTNPVNAKNQAKLEKAAKANLDKYTNLAQAEGKKYGIEFDLDSVYASLKKQYGKQVQSAVNNQVANAQGFAKNNPNKQVQKSLNSIVTQGAKEASKAMKANGLNGNIQNKVKKEFNQKKGPALNKLAARQKQAIKQLNKKIDQQKF